MRIVGTNDVFPGGAALCRIDKKRKRFEICMVENFLKTHTTALSQKVWLSTLFFAHTMARATRHEDIHIMNPKQRYVRLYQKYGFFEDATCSPHLNASLDDIEEAIARAMKGMQ
ncbi:hypothetical protein D8682_04655 [Buttiauxella sp. 3AFRM03]|uniref:hypothetical protein n=1 Tax=Buttiauxella sp. 3AFRM03 TaxID=2479367 RepID=UPI000EF77391|nr:hypothetical protein [Buttiauxella sp. 3AFRM03]AYN26349.1 hypothetical protein D8682_04655 [Buttiauxella sp. 3AFRM03]